MSVRVVCVACGNVTTCSPNTTACCASRKPTGEQTIELNDEQIRLLERFSPEFRERQIEVHYTGELVAVDTFFVGALRGGQGVSANRTGLLQPPRLGTALHQQAAGDSSGSCAQ